MLKSDTINVLYVDDEIHGLKSFTSLFRRKFNVFTAASASEAEKILENNSIHVLITDQKMPVKTGTEFLAETVLKYPDQSRILITAYADNSVLVDAINKGHIYMFLQKPWDNDNLERCIKEGYDDFYKRKVHKDQVTKLSKVNKILKRSLRKKR